jgi:hypothetical protein
MARRPPPRRMPPLGEDPFLRQILQLAKLYRWYAYHTHDSRHSEKGWPDLALLKRGVLILAEVKKQDGEVTPEQEAVIALLRQVPGIIVEVWRPSDWLHIQQLLTSRPHHPVTAGVLNDDRNAKRRLPHG